MPQLTPIQHQNLVLADCEEFRVLRNKSNGVEVTEKRLLGLVILRGSNIVAHNLEGPPPADAATRLGAPSGPSLAHGPGISKPIGRGAPPTGLLGPAPGVGPGPMGPPPGFGGPPGGFPPPGFAGPGRGAPPREPFRSFSDPQTYTNSSAAGFGGPPQGFSGPPGGAPPGFAGGPPGAPGFQGSPPGQGRGFPPPGFGGR